MVVYMSIQPSVSEPSPVSDSKAPRRGVDSGIPLYVRIAADIEGGIAEHRHQVGDFLPNESELAKHYGVSRSTVREALNRLKEQKLVETRHGIGTRIASLPSRRVVAYAVGDLVDFEQSARKGRLVKIDSERRRLRPYEAIGLPMDRSKPYMVTRAFRVLVSDPKRRLALVKLYIPCEFSEIEPEIGKANDLVAHLIERRYGVLVADIRQEIASPRINSRLRQELRALGIEIDSQRALTSRYAYLTDAGQPIEATETVFIDPDFTFVTTLSRTVKAVTNGVGGVRAQ